MLICRNDLNQKSESKQPLTGPFPCMKNGSSAKYDGKINKDGLPTGKGYIKRSIDRKTKYIENMPCYDILPSIEKIKGKFVNGILDGKAAIRYKDKTKMKVIFNDGVIQGLVSMWDNKEILQGVGTYENGLPHGPFWIIESNFFVQIYFEEGKTIQENVVLIDLDKKTAQMGTLAQGIYLTNVTSLVDFKIHLSENGLYVINPPFQNKSILATNEKIV